MKYELDNINRRNKNIKTTKIIINIIVIVLLYNIILILISCVNKIDNISLFGFKAYIITTDSMKPSINKEDVVIVKKRKRR